ncbi:hypothetical protein HK102_005550 [Quaeritorhiza haematococci]|nr:hypothetical protein HK102_005550 [Quaeritorhiza haematococci]
MPISLAAATVFSEGFWQRVWASVDERNLKRGAIMGAVMVSLTCFVFGFGGVLALWANYPQSDPTGYGSTLFFDLLTGGTPSAAPVWITIIVALITVVMNEGAVDSYQAALTSTLVAVIPIPNIRNTLPLWVSRLAVIVINIPIVVISLQSYNITSLFLIGNVLASISVLPVLLGLYEPLDAYISQFSALVGIFTGFWAVALFGYIQTGSTSLADGFQYAFFLAYDWPTFIIGPIASVVGMGVWAGGEMVVRTRLGMEWPLGSVRERVKARYLATVGGQGDEQGEEADERDAKGINHDNNNDNGDGEENGGRSREGTIVV